ncbi:MAG TPA: thiolase family protein, partial [Candidatus Binatia bacterium]|nr:thiolase family protein [Candidatus Binatia bacterium]
VTVERDEHVRPGTTLEGLAKLEPVFREGGTVTAGNSSGICDGAAALVVMSEEAAGRRGLEPLARVVGWASAGVDPRYMGWGVVPSTQKLLGKLGWTLPEVDVVEVNEAFAAQVLACDRELKFDWERTNVNGGAIAIGHPIGATGARIVAAAAHELHRRGGRRALATLCISGGQGMAVALERP